MPFEGEELEHVGGGHDFAVAAGGPADEGDEVDEGFGEIAGAAEVLDVDFGEFDVEGVGEFDGGFDGVGFFGHEVLEVFEGDSGFIRQVLQVVGGILLGIDPRQAGGTMGLDGGAGDFGFFALGHFGVVHVEDEGEVAVVGRGPAESLIQADVFEGVHEVFLGTEDVGDAHEMVVDDDGEVEGGEAVGFTDNDIIMLVGFDGDVAEDEVVDGDVFVGHFEAEDWSNPRPGLRGGDAAGHVAAVAEGFFGFFGGLRMAASCWGDS